MVLASIASFASVLQFRFKGWMNEGFAGTREGILVVTVDDQAAIGTMGPWTARNTISVPIKSK